MADEPPAEKPDPNLVALIAIGSFHEQGNFQGRLLHGGDTFHAERSRAVELRANGLVRYADVEAEKAATSDETAATDGADRLVITSKSAVRPAQVRTK